MDSRDQLIELNTFEQYDKSWGYENETPVMLNPGLSEKDKELAKLIYKTFSLEAASGLWGVAIIAGPPGAGKDLGGNIFTHQIKRLFPHKRILRDEPPRPLYGPYAGLFNPEFIRDDLDKMKEVAKHGAITNYDNRLQKAADAWVTEKGVVMLKSSVLYSTEYWRWCYKREPHSPMNKTMGGVHKNIRHIDSLIFGSVQLVSDLDKYTCLPFVNWQINCGRSKDNPTVFTYLVYRVVWEPRKLVLAVKSRRPTVFSFDAGKPKSYLGDGKIRIIKPDYIPENENEEIILNVIKSGVDNYEDMVQLLTTQGDWVEDEVLHTLKVMKFSQLKRVIDYPCLFEIYNSKSPPQL